MIDSISSVYLYVRVPWVLIWSLHQVERHRASYGGIIINMTPENHSYLTSIAVGFAIAITCIAIFLRLLARKVQKLPLGADDYVIIVGAVSLPVATNRRCSQADELSIDLYNWQRRCVHLLYVFTSLSGPRSLIVSPANKYGNGRHLKTLHKDEIINYWKVYRTVTRLTDHL